MKANEIQLNQDWILVKPDRLKTFKHTEVLPQLPQETLNVVKDEVDVVDVEEIEVEEVERVIAYIIQRGTVLAIGPGETMFKVGDKVFLRGGTGVDFQWIGSPAKEGSCPKLLKKYEIIGKVI